MHLADGFAPASACLGGYALTGLLTWFSLQRSKRRVNPSQAVPRAALLTATFFAASLIHIRIPPTSVHLILNGLVGVILGDLAFISILVGLILQAILLNHGGLTTLGINAVIIGVPALMAGQLFQILQIALARFPERLSRSVSAFMAGSCGIACSVLLFVGLLITIIPSDFAVGTEHLAIMGLAVAHIPIMLLEGLFTAGLVLFLSNIKPELIAKSASR